MSKLPGLTDEETQALRVVLAFAIGRDKVSVESKKFLDGHPSTLPDGIKAKLAEASAIIRKAAQ